MPTLAPIVIAVLIGGLGALIGGILLLLRRRISDSIVHVLVSFAAGALLGTALLELLPEAAEHAEEVYEAGGELNIFLWVLMGILFFYFLERGIHWFQHHRKVHKGTHGSVNVPLVIIGDSVHNFIDGVAIAITFLVNPALGFTTALAVIAHELPQEVGDFAVLLHEGVRRRTVFIINLFSALLAVLGAALTLLIGEQIESILPYALSLTAGFFLYIALSNLLPEIHREEKKGYAFYESLFLLIGVLVSWFASIVIPYTP